MKKIFFAAVLFGLALASCQKQDELNVNHPTKGEQVQLTVGVQGKNLATRATGVSEGAAGEGKVNKLEVFVFDAANNQLEAYGTANNATEVVVSCTAGERVIYALVNAEDDLSAVATVDQLLAVVSDLSDNEVAGFEMIGSTTTSVTKENETVPVSIDVNRFAARVVIREIVRDFTSTALQAVDFSVDAIYITNVATQMNYGYTMTNNVWYNQFSTPAEPFVPYVSECGDLTYDAVGADVAEDASYATEHFLYGYPNPHFDGELDESDVDLQAETRLVIETTLDGVKRFYPIALPALQSNKSYEVAKLTLTRPGSLSPDQEITVVDALFEVNVVDWTTVLLGEEGDGNITI